jgi:hypothetical protein
MKVKDAAAYMRGWDDGKADRDPDFESLNLGKDRLNDYERGYIDSGHLDEPATPTRDQEAAEVTTPVECLDDEETTHG